MKREIVVTKEEREHLMKIFRCGDRMIRDALSGRSSSDLALRIRKAALECGGEAMITLREMETFHTADRVMVNNLPNGVTLKFFRDDNHGELWYKGILKEQVDNVTVSVIYEMQERAAKMR